MIAFKAIAAIALSVAFGSWTYFPWAASANSISTKIDDISDDFEKLTQDKELTKSIRDLTIGLSKFLNEIYP